MASSPHQIEAFARMLFEGHNANVYAVLDGAATANLADYREQHQAAFACLYRGDLDPEVKETAPYLAVMAENSPLTDWVLGGIGKHWGIFAIAEANMRAMRKHFRSFLMVYDSANQPLYFRYYDPRILRSFLPVCHPQQRQAVFGPVSRYFAESENADTLLSFLPEKPERERMAASRTLAITGDQMERLKHCAFMENVRQFLLERSRQHRCVRRFASRSPGSRCGKTCSMVPAHRQANMNAR